MTTKVRIAVAIQVILMLVGFVSPAVVKTVGTTVYLETSPVDPQSLFRGDFVILGYAAGEGVLSPSMVEEARESGRPVYVTLTTERPGRFVNASFHPPTLLDGQFCLLGRVRQSSAQGTVDFPDIAQYFVPEGQGQRIQNQLGTDLLAEIKVTGRCNAVLVGLVPR